MVVQAQTCCKWDNWSLQNTLSCKRVFSKVSIDYFETFFSIVKFDSIWTILSLVKACDMEIMWFNIKTIFFLWQNFKGVVYELVFWFWIFNNTKKSLLNSQIIIWIQGNLIHSRNHYFHDFFNMYALAPNPINPWHWLLLDERLLLLAMKLLNLSSHILHRLGKLDNNHDGVFLLMCVQLTNVDVVRCNGATWVATMMLGMNNTFWP